MKIEYETNEAMACKVLQIVDRGLTRGLGRQEPGELCLEAAVCLAYGLDHGDEPTCVGPAVRVFGVTLNDLPGWSSNLSRANGLRRYAIAQLGSHSLNQNQFQHEVIRFLLREIIPECMDYLVTKEVGTAPAVYREAAKRFKTLERLSVNEELLQLLTEKKVLEAEVNWHDNSLQIELSAGLSALIDAMTQLDLNLCEVTTLVNEELDRALNLLKSLCFDKERLLRRIAEGAVQVLIGMGSPGYRFLYLTDDQ